jgi:hypothetical protein
MGDSAGMGAWMASVYIGFVIGIVACVWGHFKEKRDKQQKGE